MKKAVFIFWVLFLLMPFNRAKATDVLLVGAFSKNDLTGWEEKEFKGKTHYTLTNKNNKIVLKATSRNAASGLFKKIEIDPKTYPILRWSWKIQNILPTGDARYKNQDDYSARIYVIFSGFFFWQTKGINYIWANRLPKGKSIKNAYTENVIMIAVQSGPKFKEKWLNQSRNVYNDFKRLFGEEPPMIEAVAIMTDSDNTSGMANAFYGDIFFEKARGK